MNLFLVIIFYTITAGGTFTKTVQKHPVVMTVATCEETAARIKVDPLLNNHRSYVYSAKCVQESPDA